ncbi:MAG: hypothetical protein AABZ15_11705 [Nitrospirota bacterium]
MKHIGLHAHRLNENNPREIAFSEIWKEENNRDRAIGLGNGTLQDLMIQISSEPKEGFHRTFGHHLSAGGSYAKCSYEITQRDAEIVATVVQWLGSNVGMCFLGQALKKFGKQIVDIK